MIEKEKIKIFFTDFWEDFDMHNNVFIKALQSNYDIEVNSDNPDILFYSWLGDNFKYFNCIRIYYTPENLKPKYRECDFSLSFELWNDSRNLRFPNYLLYNLKPENLIKNNINPEKVLASKTGFCSFLITNKNSHKRVEFFNNLSKYKKVDSGGRVLNNIGRSVENKLDFIKNYKFNIAFENTMSDGYTTEKIVEAMYANTIPIYWGNNKISEEFNTRSFFNYNDYNSESDLIEDIIAHDTSQELYLKKISEPWFIDNKLNEYFKQNRLTVFLTKIINNRKSYKPIAKNLFKKKIYYPIGYQINTIRAKFLK